MTSECRVIVALDFDDATRARQLITQLGAACSFYKVGLQLLTAEGPHLIRELVAQGKQVFLDLKLHEIPNSVAGAVTAAGKLGASMVSVHAMGGSAVLRAAVEAARPFPELRVLALTVITSMGEEELAEIGIDGSLTEQVTLLAKLAAAAGCHGVIASPREAELLRRTLGPDMWIVTPGAQPASEAKTDQTRTATPAQAIAAGATHLVIGRAITSSPDPLRTFRAICEQVATP